MSLVSWGPAAAGAANGLLIGVQVVVRHRCARARDRGTFVRNRRSGLRRIFDFLQKYLYPLPVAVVCYLVCRFVEERGRDGGWVEVERRVITRTFFAFIESDLEGRLTPVWYRILRKSKIFTKK